MKTTPNPECFLRRSPLLPGESLGSLLARLAMLNGYDAQHTPRSLVVPDLGSGRTYNRENWDNPIRPSMPKTYERLATLTKLNPIELYSATEHSLSATITPPDYEIETITLSGEDGGSRVVPIITNKIARVQFHMASNTQYCPICLREDSTPFHRALWSVKALTICQWHEVVLMRECAECHSPIQVRDIVAGTCRKCAADLGTALPCSVAGDQLGLLAQQIIRAWVLGEQAPLEAQSSYGLPLSLAPSRVLYRIVQGLAYAVWRAEPTWEFIHQLAGFKVSTASEARGGILKATPYQIYCLYTTAVKALMSWPTNFHAFLSGYRTYRRSESGVSHRYAGALFSDLDTLYNKWLNKEWRHGEFAFVQAAFETFLAANQARARGITRSARYRSNRNKLDELEFMSMPEVEVALDLSPSAILKLMRTNHIKGHANKLSHNTFYYYLSRADVQELEKRRHAERWLADIRAAQMLDVDWRSLGALRRAGLLVAIHGPDVDGFPIWLYSQDAVSVCASRLAGKFIRLSAHSDVSGLISLAVTNAMLTKSKSSDKALFDLVLAGKIPAYLYSKRSIKLPLLRFAEADIRACFGKPGRRVRAASP